MKKRLMFLLGVAALAAVFAACDPAPQTPTASSVTVTSATESVARGSTLQFSATVAGENSPAQTVTWSITTTGLASGTAISDTGLLTVAAAETVPSIEVKATSTVDTSKSGTKSVSVTGTSTGSLIEMVSIPGGTFTMGETGWAGPIHTVTVGAFSIGKYEVTQAEYEAVTGSNPGSFISGAAAGEVQGRRPVERVSWYDAIVFCNRLSMREWLTPAYTIGGSTDPDSWGTVPTSQDSTWDTVTVNWDANGYRLPTEAEWEYACRAGTTTAYNSTGDTISDATGWYYNNSVSRTHEVGKKPANAWVLYDMHGNVWEWCWDWYGSYDSAAQTDPRGPSSGSNRDSRGGSWSSGGGSLRSAYRGHYYPEGRYDSIGFRLVRP